jgi:cytochrome b involved in lipid metabolism
MGHFESFHPGGYFTLIKNYGRDITKYFNGAYKLVNNIEKEI